MKSKLVIKKKGTPMSRGSADAIPPQDPGRNRQQYDFGPHQFDNGARRIEQGISMGQGSQALHEELSLMRQAAMQNGTFNLAQYKADVKAIDQKLHRDGFLPNIHLDVDSKGQDIVKRGGGDTTADASEVTGSRRGHGRGHSRRHGRGGGHGRGGHHRRGHSRGGDAGRGGDQSDEGQVASADTLNEQDLRPDDPGARRADRTQDMRPDRSQSRYEADPNKDRSSHGGRPDIWGPPTISAAGIDKVLRDNNSPAAGLGSYIYDQAKERGINPAFALAMYGQESTFGTKGAAVRNNSFGNIRAGRHGFKHYDDVKQGIDHWMDLMSSSAYKGKDLAGVIHKYAPGSDGNNPRGYMAYVTNNMNKWARMDGGDPDQRRYA
ncbi:MAG: glucosaminidase domain-containing protein [Cyanobacteria bacterium SZAS-4]|nr:glucosaminidase domain-containing protein [Cyanobacteria bacterium SZAS-4]